MTLEDDTHLWCFCRGTVFVLLFQCGVFPPLFKAKPEFLVVHHPQPLFFFLEQSLPFAVEEDDMVW